MGAYEFTVDLWDYGDAPDPLLGTAGKYPTLFVNNGPRHLVGSLFLGASIDAERDGQPNATATGDDTADSDDEDGVALPTTLVARVGGQATVTASAPGKLDAWIDFNRNGIFESGEQIAASLPVAAGANAVMFAVPDSIVAGTSYARFRLSTAGGLLPTGEASDGEVEDYAISLVKPATGSVQVIADPENPGRSLLLINGTSISNSIVARITAPGTVTVYIAPEVVIGSFPLNSFDRIIVFGLAGNDSIAIEAPINKPTTLYGDEGNDTIVGGQGADIIIGGDGIDSMVGNGGDDVFYGGAGNDSISGGAGFDRFIEMAGSATVTATSSKVGTSSDTFTQIEQIELTGTAASDIFVLNSVNLIVLLDAGADADTLAYTGDGKSCSRIRS